MKRYLLQFILLILLVACSTGKKAFDRGDFYQAVSKSVERLQSDPDNKKALRVLTEAYPLAVKYYQEEIDLTLTSDGPFKWTKTLGIMGKVNDMASMIRRVPSARKVAKNLKIYTDELRPAKERAAEENYLAGLELLQSGTRADAKNAFSSFVVADELIPGYKDVNALIKEAKELATLYVLIDPIRIYSRVYALNSDFFYNQVFGMLKYNFPDSGFLYFLSQNEMNNKHIQPDMILRMDFYDFVVSRNNHSENEEILKKVIEEKVKVTIGDSVTYKTVQHEYKGKIKVLNDQVFTDGILAVELYDYLKDYIVVEERIPGNFVWTNSYGIFLGDKEVLDNQHLSILNNRAYPPPPPQDLFNEFTRPIFDQLSNFLKSYFRKYR